MKSMCVDRRDLHIRVSPKNKQKDVFPPMQTVGVGRFVVEKRGGGCLGKATGPALIACGPLQWADRS